MTAQTLGPTIVPRQPWGIAGSLAYLSITMDTSPEEVDTIFHIPKTGTISKIWFRTGSFTVGDTLKVGLYTVDPATGLPTTTAYGGMVAGTRLLATVTDENKAIDITLGTSCSATEGNLVALVIEYNSYVAGNVKIAVMSGSTATTGVFPYIVADTGAGLAKQSLLPLMLLEYSDGTFPNIPGVYPWVSALDTVSIHLNSTPDEVALRFKFLVPTRLCAMSLHGGQGNDADFVCYGDTTVTTTHDGEIIGSTSVRSQDYPMDGPVLSANTVHRMAIKALEATNTVSVLVGQVPSAAAMEAADGGVELYYSTRSNGAGTWDDDTTKRPLISLHLDQFSDGAGGSGGPVAGNMRGGFIN